MLENAILIKSEIMTIKNFYAKNIVWNPSTCLWEFDKHCEIDEYSKNSTCMKILENNLVICVSLCQSILLIKNIKLIIIFLTLISNHIVINNRYYLLLLNKIFDKAKIHIATLTFK